MSDGYTSAEFQNVRKALLACSNADRAYLRRWILQWVDEHGHINKDAEQMPGSLMLKNPGTTWVP